EGTIIKNVAVLVDLEEGSATVCISSYQHALQVLRITVHAPGHKGCVCSHRQRQWIERMVNTTHRGRFGHLVLFRCRRILSFGKTIYLVVKQQYVHVEIAPQQVDRMISANAEAIAIAGNNPYAEVRARRFQSACNGGGTSMD